MPLLCQMLFLQYDQRGLCFLARPVMIVTEFMSNGSLDSFLQVWQATKYDLCQ